MKSIEQKRRVSFYQWGLSLAIQNCDFGWGLSDKERSEKAMKAGANRKHLPGGIRGMSQRQRRKRIRQGVLSK